MYERFFGLTDAPFRLTPDPRYLFLSPKHSEALAHLRLGLTEPGGFVCITGDIGTGKTTLLRAFLDGLGADVDTAYVFNPTLSAGELVQRIVRELGVPVTGDSQMELMDALDAHLLSQRKLGRLSVAVIDEAQAVSIEVLEQLRLLSNLETSTEKLLRLVLVGQPQLAALLLDPALAQLNQRITLRWHLGPLTPAETAAYVRHRLAVASGGHAGSIFTRPALWLVHRFSRGVPRLVNMIAHRALLVSYVARRRRVSAGAVLRAYREIRAVPLRSTSRVRRAGWAVAVTAVALVVVTLGMPHLGRQLPHMLPGVATGAAPTAVERSPAPAIAAAATDLAVAPVPPATPPRAALRTAPAAPASVASLSQVEEWLVRVEPAASERAALDAVLAAWRATPLEPNEVLVPGDLRPVAWPRNLEVLSLTGNLSMLRLLDLPAVLELRPAGVAEPRHAAITGIDDRDVVLSIVGRAVRVEPAVLDRLWLGQSHILWRDFENLGRTFGIESQGAHVARLQRLLARVQLYDRSTTGSFDTATADAVLDFQRSRMLVPDCRVGRLTRIVLYGAIDDYQRPTLMAAGGRS